MEISFLQIWHIPGTWLTGPVRMSAEDMRLGFRNCLRQLTEPRGAEAGSEAGSYLWVVTTRHRGLLETETVMVAVNGKVQVPMGSGNSKVRVP